MIKNKSILAAIQTYYYNCGRQFDVKYSDDISKYIAEKSDFHWDKEADLNNITAILKKNKSFVNFQAMGGTFWITYKTRRGHLKTVTTNERIFPQFEPYKAN